MRNVLNFMKIMLRSENFVHIVSNFFLIFLTFFQFFRGSETYFWDNLRIFLNNLPERIASGWHTARTILSTFLYHC